MSSNGTITVEQADAGEVREAFNSARMLEANLGALTAQYEFDKAALVAELRKAGDAFKSSVARVGKRYEVGAGYTYDIDSGTFAPPAGPEVVGE